MTKRIDLSFVDADPEPPIMRQAATESQQRRGWRRIDMATVVDADEDPQVGLHRKPPYVPITVVDMRTGAPLVPKLSPG
jgi:hypothetical protein